MVSLSTTFSPTVPVPEPVFTVTVYTEVDTAVVLVIDAPASPGRYAVLRGMNHDQKDHNVGGTIGLTGHVAGAKASGGVPFPGKVRPNLGALISYLTRGRRGYWPVTCIGPVCKVSGEQLRGQTAGTL